MSVKAWMATEPITIKPDTEVREARALMRDNGVRHLPVVDDGRLVGRTPTRSSAEAGGAILRGAPPG